MFVTSAPMSLVGVALATWLERRHGEGTESVGAKVLGAALILGGLGVFARSLFRVQARSDASFRLARRDRAAALAIGFFGGLIVGLTSAPASSSA